MKKLVLALILVNASSLCMLQKMKRLSRVKFLQACRKKKLLPFLQKRKHCHRSTDNLTIIKESLEKENKYLYQKMKRLDFIKISADKKERILYELRSKKDLVERKLALLARVERKS